MNRKWMFSGSVLAAFVLASVSALAQGVTEPVKVMNSTSQPVPTAAQGTTNVAGTVNVGNTPSVSVTNTPSVNVANTPSVNVTNTSIPVTFPTGATVGVTNPTDQSGNPIPLAVSEAAQQPTGGSNIDWNPNPYCSATVGSVPEGKQLVIQEVDGDAQTPCPAILTSVMVMTDSGPHLISWVSNGSFNTGVGEDYAYAWHQPTTLYITGPASVNFQAFAATFGVPCQACCTFAWSGYLIDVASDGSHRSAGGNVRRGSGGPALNGRAQ